MKGEVQVPRWATGLTWKITGSLFIAKIVGMIFDIPMFAKLPVWSWNPFELSVMFLVNWSIWGIGLLWFIVIVLAGFSEKIKERLDDELKNNS